MTLPDIRTVASVLGGDVTGGQALVPGPGHSPKDRSLSVKIDSGAPDGFVVYSHAGDDPLACKDYIREKLGIRRDEKPVRREMASASIMRMQDRIRSRVVAEHVYRDPDGLPSRMVQRMEPKGPFPQFRWNGTKWIAGVKDVPIYPYRLPELLKAGHSTVFICEGEKDADRLGDLGFVTTTNPMGAGCWHADLNKWFEGRTCYLLEDNDAAGRDHVRKVAEHLVPIAGSVRVVALPGLPEKGDVSDWIDAGGDTNRLVEMCEAAPLWRPAGQSAPLLWLDMSSWDAKPIPERKWSIKDRVPLKQAGLFSGEGGTGKSIIELMKNVAHVMGKDWLGSLPEPGPAFYLGAEDDEDEIHIRLAAIANHYDTTFSELAKGGLRILPLLGKDATLCAVTNGGKIEITNLYRQIYEAAGDLKPKNISIDTLSRAFAGNEIDRVQVYAFAMHMQALAKVANGSVTVLSHPSLQGISSGSGISGSTAWHGAFRFRQYLKGVKGDDDQSDNDLRQLEFKKNQYGPRGESIILRYQNGLFLPEGGVSDFDKAARSAKAEEVFATLLRRFSTQNRNVGDKPTSPNYAPTAFAKEEEANKHRLAKHELENAMRELFRCNRIGIEDYGRPSRPASRLVIK